MCQPTNNAEDDDDDSEDNASKEGEGGDAHAFMA